MGIPDHLTCLFRNLYAGQEATVRTAHETTDWFQIRKGVRQGCILSPCLFNLYAEYISEVSGWMKHNLESRLPGEISTTQICRWYHPYGRKRRRTKEPLDESESEKAGLKFHIQNRKIMASGHITSRQIDGETVTDFILWGSKITADGDWSHEIKRCLFLGRKAMTNLDSTLKSRNYFVNKGPSSQSYGFSSSHVWMWVGL